MFTSTGTKVDEQIDYPETDGKPMAESDLHRDIMFLLIRRLQRYFVGKPVYVSGNLLIYYEPGNRRKAVAPDCFVIFDVDQRRRTIYKLWEEEKVPSVVFEITSKSTQHEDLGAKMRLYAQLGVREYFIYDPTSEYLQPALAAFELAGGGYVPMQPLNEPVVLGDMAFFPGEAEPPEYLSNLLGLRLTLDEQNALLLFDAHTGEPLLSDEEARQFAEARASDAEHRVAQVEAENAQLRAELARLRGVT
jgi:Uma2 family endonuclease